MPPVRVKKLKLEPNLSQCLPTTHSSGFPGKCQENARKSFLKISPICKILVSVHSLCFPAPFAGIFSCIFCSSLCFPALVAGFFSCISPFSLFFSWLSKFAEGKSSCRVGLVSCFFFLLKTGRKIFLNVQPRRNPMHYFTKKGQKTPLDIEKLPFSDRKLTKCSSNKIDHKHVNTRSISKRLAATQQKRYCC